MWGQGKTTRAQFQNWLCYEATTACSKKAPPVPADREKGPAFEPVDEKERSVQKMMESMKVRIHPLFVTSFLPSLPRPASVQVQLLCVPTRVGSHTIKCAFNGEGKARRGKPKGRIRKHRTECQRV